ncbi:hypothetical protein J421_6016 (plasmid) [Gemmatirosa kalamazoonensis]|uniref:DUF5916 domain-containing protein n=1 Tax=Gemmatirosa kalamazoonensis TaxID=861299 RepID=W0RS71_9BACT|nr:carbohydrate binding family 9 domain-containing protein [Gemmatirosa kalamazoonensis]AHG93551.1 hypothetical protein J421_6016 [Gemmatirosa kalamazoonensis]
MLPFAALLATLLAAATPPDDFAGRTYAGRSRELDVAIPRHDSEGTVDGRLDEAAWRTAARLTGFSRYAPTDDAPADDSTQVLVWYSPTAIHFGIRAFAEPGTVRATLADRDKIYTGDYIGIFLGTFNDGRQATVFAVNPLGVQGDGIVVESGRSSGGGFQGLQSGREPTDISPDYVFESKGRLTDFGYEVEIRIPFKSLRYQSLPSQTWGVNVIRVVQSRGVEYSWAPAQRAAASYLAQSGHLVGLSGLRRGLVLDLNPVVTERAVGGPTTARGYAYDAQPARLGGNVRWGMTNNVTLNATVRPDFAEVESDAGQIAFDPRQALFFAEKRPFFLDGIEQLNVPNQLVYTRRITSPLGAVKVSGKAAGVDFAALSAADDRAASADGDARPWFEILRLQRDVGRSSRAGFVYTDREEHGHSNRVVGVDSRAVWRKIYSAQLQGAYSRTTAPDAPTREGPLYMVDLRRTGRSFVARYLFNAMHDEFDAQSGFISRPAVTHLLIDHTARMFGAQGSALRSASFDVSADGLWKYRKFVTRGDMLEKKLHLNTNYELRGGWKAGVSYLLETFGYDPDFYDGRLVASATDTVPFVGLPRITNHDWVFSVTTPNYRRVSASATYIVGRDENFFEWAPANIGYVSAAVDWRPTDQLRVGGTYLWQWYRRPTDGSMVGETRIPRVKAEYQITRAVFVRAVGEYRADYADDLRDAAGASAIPGGTILVPDGRGGYLPGRGFTTATGRARSVNSFRPELLFSYMPSPGTVVFVGYGSTLGEADALRFSGLRRQRDAVFVKMSYLLRRA